MSGRRSTPSSAGATSSSGRLKKNPNFFQSSPSAQSFSKDIPSGVLSQARKTGTLNLSDKGIRDIPHKLWRLNIDPPEEADVSFGGGDSWWEQMELTRLNLSSNEIRELSGDIVNFKSLQILDLQYNQITQLPDSICELPELNKLYISHNQLITLPTDIGNLRNLQFLQVSNNKLASVPASITQLVHLEELDLSVNQLQALPDDINCLVQIKFLNVSENKLTQLPAGIGNMRELTKLYVAQNKLSVIPPLTGLEKIAEIDLKRNQLTEFPLVQPGRTLKSLLLGTNIISTLDEEKFLHLTGLTILSLRENKLTQLPESIVKLTSLQRLDLSYNDLSSIPYIIGTMDTLHSLLLEGNPLRTVRRDVIRKGTVELLKYLRSKIELDASTGISEPIRSPAAVKISSSPYKEFRDESRAKKNEIELTKKNLTEIPEDIFDLPAITILNVSYNKLTSLSNSISKLNLLTRLDLRNNQLSDLPKSLSQCKKLNTVNISCNRFTEIPTVVYMCLSIENLFANNNQIQSISVDGLLELKELHCLDLGNNDISHVPPQLGNVEWLRHLELGGNSFRTPRLAILSKGTASLLEYLRDRIPR